MTQIQLVTGLYTLAAPIPNPQPDRRRTRDWASMENFPAGTYEVDNYTARKQGINIDFIGRGGGGVLNSNGNPEQFAAIAPHLVLKPKEQYTLGELLHTYDRHAVCGTDVLAMLLIQGVIGMRDIDIAAFRVTELSDMERDDFEKRHGIRR